jgi:hypothetical protein
MNPRLKNNKET